MLAIKLLLGIQVRLPWEVRVGQKNLVNTDKIFLFKHLKTFYIRFSAGSLLSLKFPSYASSSSSKASFQTQYLFTRVSVLLCFSSRAAFIFFFPLPSFSLLVSQVLCMLTSFVFFTLPKALAVVYIWPRSLPLPASSRQWLNGSHLPGLPRVTPLGLGLEEATEVCVVSVAPSLLV